MSSFELIGKKEPLENIKTGIASGRLSHAVLLSGEKGVGKKFFSKHIIKMLVCQNKNKPCGICAQCQKIDKDIHPDVFNIFPAGKSETIGVKEIAPIKASINIKPNPKIGDPCEIYISTPTPYAIAKTSKPKTPFTNGTKRS